MQRLSCFVAMILCCACSADVIQQRGAATQPAGIGQSVDNGTRGAAGSPAIGGNPGAALPPPVQPVTPVVPAMPTPPAAGGPVCRETHVDVRPQVPDMLIVLDRSGSMAEQGRWDPSLTALERVTQQLQEKIRFGLALFPDPDANANVDIDSCARAPNVDACVQERLRDVDVQACAPGRIVVPVAAQNAAPIAQALQAARPLGGTPTPGTLEGLLATFAAPAVAGVGMATAPAAKFVLLVTDGQPTCPSGRGRETTPQDVDASNAAVEALARAGVKTYVIGYDTSGPGNEMLAQVLDGLAMRGNTGDSKHRPVEDESSLVLELQGITASLVECGFVLDMAPQRADHVFVQLDGKQINLGAVDGWMLEGDRTIRFAGATCGALRDGKPHAVDVEVRCSVVVPQ